MTDRPIRSMAEFHDSYGPDLHDNLPEYEREDPWLERLIKGLFITAVIAFEVALWTLAIYGAWRLFQ